MLKLHTSRAGAGLAVPASLTGVVQQWNDAVLTGGQERQHRAAAKTRWRFTKAGADWFCFAGLTGRGNGPDGNPG